MNSFSFSIQKQIFLILKNIENEKVFSFKLHQTDKLANKLIHECIINPINKETSILKLKYKRKTPRKNIHILINLLKFISEVV